MQKQFIACLISLFSAILLFFSSSSFAEEQLQRKTEFKILEKKYKVDGVFCKIIDYSDIYEVKNKCFENAKDEAFASLMKHLNEGINFSTKQIDTTIESFEITKENFLDNEYSVFYNFIFDKNAIQEIINKINNTNDISGSEKIILKIYNSKPLLINDMFAKIKKIHTQVSYFGLNKNCLKLELNAVSEEKLKLFLKSNYITFNDFKFSLTNNKEKPNIIEIY